MASPPIRVAVVGGGIIGVSSALRIIEARSDVQVTIIADKFSPNTTSDVAAGFWNPYLLGKVPIKTLRFWCKETFDYILQLIKSSDCSSAGVGLLSAYRISEEPLNDPPHSDIFLNYRNLTEEELSIFPSQYKYGKFFTTVYAECGKLLPYLTRKFKDKGGRIMERKIQSLRELIGQYDILINCSGLESFNLVPDQTVIPIRGQTIRVYAPWIKHAVINSNFHILPNSELVVCGGTHQDGDWNTNVDPSDKEKIWNGCCELVPSLKGAKILKDWVGLRPSRFKPRIEREVLKNEEGNTLEVIHNYGHGGSGVTLFWGCAYDVAKLVDESIAGRQKLRLTSNL